MKDGVAKGTGNSRYLKSAISDNLTWEQFRAMLRGGTLPIDLNGINTAGWQVVGDALNKANLLPDSLAKSLGLTQSNPQVKDALGLFLEGVKIQFGTYVGTGIYGKENPSSITFNSEPAIVIMLAGGGSSTLSDRNPMMFPRTELTTTPQERRAWYSSNTGSYPYGYKSKDGLTMYWYGGGSSTHCYNTSGVTYYYFAIG